MGTDIDGAIERRSGDGRWRVAADVVDLGLGRDHEAWSVLFGVRGTEDVERPLFAGRGLPDDVSDPVRETAVGDYQHSHTHATWADVRAVDWDAPLASGPAWSWAARFDAAGPRVVPATPDLAEAAADTFGGHLLLAPCEWPPDGEVLLDGVLHRPVVLTARMLAPPDEAPWEELWRAMRDLAAGYGDENVRLVVWFG